VTVNRERPRRRSRKEILELLSNYLELQYIVPGEAKNLVQSVRNWRQRCGGMSVGAIEAGVATIALNRPEVRNAIDDEMRAQFNGIVERGVGRARRRIDCL
jgi:hypothetical protein